MTPKRTPRQPQRGPQDDPKRKPPATHKKTQPQKANTKSGIEAIKKGTPSDESPSWGSPVRKAGREPIGRRRERAVVQCVCM